MEIFSEKAMIFWYHRRQIKATLLPHVSSTIMTNNFKTEGKLLKSECKMLNWTLKY